MVADVIADHPQIRTAEVDRGTGFSGETGEGEVVSVLGGTGASLVAEGEFIGTHVGGDGSDRFVGVGFGSIVGLKTTAPQCEGRRVAEAVVVLGGHAQVIAKNESRGIQFERLGVENGAIGFELKVLTGANGEATIGERTAQGDLLVRNNRKRQAAATDHPGVCGGTAVGL